MNRLRLVLVLLAACAATATGKPTLLDQALQLAKDDNDREALELFEKALVQPELKGKALADALNHAIACTVGAEAPDKADSMVEAAVAAHPGDWQVRAMAAVIYSAFPHQFSTEAGKPVRTTDWGKDSTEQDRVKALRLFLEAMELARKPNAAPPAELAQLDIDTAAVLVENRDWQLQILTDLTKLPDLDETPERQGPDGAAVNDKGEPLFFRVPESWETAKNDGERFRFLLHRAESTAPPSREKLLAGLAWAQFVRMQFGPHTVQEEFPDNTSAENPPTEGDFAMNKMPDEETLALLTSGPKRFRLPEDHQYVRMLAEIGAAREDAETARDALRQLARERESRSQFHKAGLVWKELLDRSGKEKDSEAESRWRAITQSWCKFQDPGTAVAGEKMKFTLEFRNATKVTFTARKFDQAGFWAQFPKIAEAAAAGEKEAESLDLSDMSEILKSKYAAPFLGEAAVWTQNLTPAEDHRDATIEITSPLANAGGYLVEAKVDGGHTARLYVEIINTILIGKPGNKALIFYAADAKSGKPIPDLPVKILALGVEDRDNKRPKLHKSEASLRTGKDGVAAWTTMPKPSDKIDWSGLILAGNGERFARLVMEELERPEPSDAGDSSPSVFLTTDRPVYRPGHTVKFKLWVAKAKIGQPGKPLAGKKFIVTITDERDSKIYEQELTSDNEGGLDGEVALAADAGLGTYSVSLLEERLPRTDPVYSGGTFRVEEYKKPEFEVAVAGPDKPVRLGEEFTATVNARYYFGAPVAKGTVEYTVKRSAYRRPSPFFRGGYSHYFPFRSGETVNEGTTDLKPDGTCEIPVRTAPAKDAHATEDQTYEISVTVTDQSRRAITAETTVLATRDAFFVNLSANRGHFAPGQQIEINLDCATANGSAVSATGKGSLRLVTRDAAGKRHEKEVSSHDLKTEQDGTLRYVFPAPAAGDYSFVASMKDAAGHEAKGDVRLVVAGTDAPLHDCDFSSLELIPDKEEYAPGDTVRLLMTTRQNDGTVALFLRPEEGLYPVPQVISLAGQSQVVEIKVGETDAPLFYVEAVTVIDGRIDTASIQIVVPPREKHLHVKVQPSTANAKPGTKVKVKLAVTDDSGKPVAAGTALAVYDKSVDVFATSGIPSILTAFWNESRNHRSVQLDSLPEPEVNWLKENESGMPPLSLPDSPSADGGVGKSPLHFGYGYAGRPVTLASAPPAPMAAVGHSFPVTPSTPMADADSFEPPQIPQTFSAGVPKSKPEKHPVLRQDFADTACWSTTTRTNDKGEAEIEFPLPDSLTTWRIRTWVMDKDVSVGEGEAELQTSKDVLVRLQAPRFFVEKDEVVLSANVHNQLPKEQAMRVILETDGGFLELMDGAKAEQPTKIAANGEARLDWRVRVKGEGTAAVRVKALGPDDSDAVQMSFPVHVHGMPKTESWSLSVRPEEQSGKLEFTIPAERRRDDTTLEIRYSPSIAMSMLDALPYLADFPHGCTEQTLNRFLPAVITRQTLQRMGVKLDDLRQQLTNFNPQELDNDRERIAQWKALGASPVFNEQKLARMIDAGTEKLKDMQNGDGGWGWFSGSGEHSTAHLTALVTRGLMTAKAAGADVPMDSVKSGLTWLGDWQRRQIGLLQAWPKRKDDPKIPAREFADDTDALGIYVLCVAEEEAKDARARDESAVMRDLLYRDRSHLSLYGKALFGMALDLMKDTTKRDMLVRNLEQFLQTDDSNQTAWLKINPDQRWWWHGDEVETHAMYLKLLCRVAPNADKTRGLVKWLVNNRKNGSYWNSTRDTALCVEAIADYLEATRETSGKMQLEVLLDGTVRKSVAISAANLFTFDNQLVLRGKALEAGKHTIEFRKTGGGPLYANAYFHTFTLEDSIGPAGWEVTVERKYWKIARTAAAVPTTDDKGQVIQENRAKEERTELKSGDVLKSGDEVEVELLVSSKNDYEYLLLEDPKPAGFEPIDLHSGYVQDGSLWAYQELRDDRSAFYVSRLPQGTHTLRHRLRAEIPGKFSALPGRIGGMYAPELKGNSAEAKFGVE